MKQRCLNRNHHAYRDYGGRGITVCDEWILSYEDFVADIEVEIGPRPGPGYSLDRINNNGHYEPGNVRWATPTVQSRNRRNTIYVEWRGKRWNLADLCDQFEIPLYLVYGRLEIGWELEDALTIATVYGKPTRIMDDKFKPTRVPSHHKPLTNGGYQVRNTVSRSGYGTVITPKEIPGRPEYEGETEWVRGRVVNPPAA